MQAIEERLRILERRFERSRRANRILVVAAVATACVAGAQGNPPVASQSKTPQPTPSGHRAPDEVPERTRLQSVEANEYVLIDDAGRPRVRMAAEDGSAAISLFDGAGRKRLELSEDGDRAGLCLFDRTESPVVSLWLPGEAGSARLEITSQEGTSRVEADGLSVQDAAGRGRVHLAFVNGNYPQLGLSTAGQNGPPSVELTAAESSRSLKLHDEAGRPTFSLHADDDGRTALNLRHPDHERSLQITTGPNEVDGPAIAFFAPASEDGTGGILPHLRLGLDVEFRPFLRITDGSGRPVFVAPSQ